MKECKEKLRLIDIDRAKGLAIFLVVIGHLVRGRPPQGNEWYSVLSNVIYRFHMPFFMFICGVVMYYSYEPINSLCTYVKYIRKKMLRLLPAFFLFGILIGIGKEVLRNFVYVDNLPSAFLSGLMDLLIRPTESFSSSLWFIYVLAAYYLIIPVLLFIFIHKLEILLLIGLSVHFLPVTHYFALHQIAQYLFVFVLGMYAMEHWNNYTVSIDKFNSAFIIFFLISFSLTVTNVPDSVSKFVIGLSSLPALHSFVRLRAFKKENLLKVLGEFTFSIYLLNTICIGLVKGITFNFISWGGLNFFFFFLLLLISGLIVPILIKRFIFRKVTWLDHITA